MFIAAILDPKTKVQTEMIDRTDARIRVAPGKENA
jgi:hypothetical protein